jgi:hypothetical protein
MFPVVAGVVSVGSSRPNKSLELTAASFSESRRSSVETSQVIQIARIVFGRTPDAAERLMMSEFLRRGGSLEHLCLALLNTNVFIYID